MAASSREEAWAWIQANRASAQQSDYLVALMRAWGSRDVLAAVEWATAQNSPWSALAVEAALSSAVTSQPELAVDISRRLLTTDPINYSTPAASLTRILTEKGRFDLATRLATGVPFAKASELTADVFEAWGRAAPSAALQAVDQISDARLRRLAFGAVVLGWAASDPAGLAEHARSEFGDDSLAFALRAATTPATAQNEAPRP